MGQGQIPCLHVPDAYDPAGYGTNSAAGSLYKATSIPTQYVIDKDGKIAAAYSGYQVGDMRLETALSGQGIVLTAVPKEAPKAAHN